MNVCDGFIDIFIGNITDETNCQHWKHDCNMSINRCDGHWHCSDGHDELHCSGNIFINYPDYPYYHECAKENKFYCVNKTNQKLECYSRELAGDGWEHCVGGLDERVNGFCQIK
jgi:hypothetical protein